MRGGNFEVFDIILGFLVAALKSATGLFNCTFQGHSQTKNSFSPVYLAHYNRQRKMGDEKPLLHIVPNESGGHFRFIQPGRPKDWLKVDIFEVCTRNAMPLLNNSPGTCLQPAGLGHRPRPHGFLSVCAESQQLTGPQHQKMSTPDWLALASSLAREPGPASRPVSGSRPGTTDSLGSGVFVHPSSSPR